MKKSQIERALDELEAQRQVIDAAMEVLIKIQNASKPRKDPKPKRPAVVKKPATEQTA